MSDNDNKMLWGVSTWIFLHTMAARISELGYKKLRGQLLAITKRICSNLPCPHCAHHAREFMRKVHPRSLPNKTVFQSMLFQFHNSVNMRLGKQQFASEELTVYKTKHLGITLQNFLTFYAKRYNGTLQAGIQSTEIIRRRIAISIQQWIQKNWGYFK